MGDLFLSDDVLSDDPPPRRSRPRWVDGLGLGALVLGIVAIGVLGDRGSPDRSTAPATTTSTTTPFRRGTPYASTSTTTTGPTSTTVVVQQLPSAGLPEPTRSVVLLSSGGSVVLVDVDRATVVRLPVASGGGMLGVDEGFVLPTGAQFQVLPSSGLPVRTVDVEPGDLQGQLLGSGGRTFWAIAGRDRQVAVELDTAGRRTGRRVEVPGGHYVAGVLDAGVVVGGHGSLTAVDAATGRLRALGTGDLLAVGGRSIVRQSCQVLVCRIELVDTVTGRARALPDLPSSDGFVQLGKLSRDGHWLAVTFDHGSGDPQLSVVHLTDGRVWTIDVEGVGPFEFSPSANVLFVARDGDLCAYETSTALPHCLAVSQPSVQMLAVAPAP